MPVATALAAFKAAVAQCDNLIANAHKTDPAGAYIFPPPDREQITVAALLNAFIAWEQFLEEVMANLMCGAPTISGSYPLKFVTPPTKDAAKKMMIGVMKYFDFSNHENVGKIAEIYFDAAYPFQPHLRALISELRDLKTMRNASAHASSTTQSALEGLALRIFGMPRPGITLYELLTSPYPGSAGETVFLVYKNKLAVAAELIANG